MTGFQGDAAQPGLRRAIDGGGSNCRQIGTHVLTGLHRLDQHAMLAIFRHPSHTAHLHNARQHGIRSLDALERHDAGWTDHRLELLDADEDAGRRRYSIYGTLPSYRREPGTDFEAMDERAISVTPIHFDLTHAAGIDALDDLGLPGVREETARP